MTSGFPGYSLPGMPVWQAADGCYTWADDRTRYLDLGMAFGSLLHGHDGSVLRALTVASDERHGDSGGVPAAGLGDIASNAMREKAQAELCRWASQYWTSAGAESDELRSVVLHTGSEAVEMALKTALRATGRSRIVSFEGAYHGTSGLSQGVTNGQKFRDPFADQFSSTTIRFAAWNTVPELDERDACVIVEPIQGRAGVRIPDAGFLSGLRSACDEAGATLIVDAVLTGAGRIGDLGAGGCNPDIVCLGKAIGLGYPASATIAKATLAVGAWDHPGEEPIHTSTHIGEWMASAAIVHALERLQSTRMDDGFKPVDCVKRVAEKEGLEVRCAGRLVALDTGRDGGGVLLAARLLEQRVLVAPSGRHGESITIYPPTVFSEEDANLFCDALRVVCAK